MIKKLKHGLCLDIIVYGGSNTCGHGIFADINTSGKHVAYPANLQRYLNELWPCVREINPTTGRVYNMSHSNPQLLDSSTENLNSSLTHVPGIHYIDNQCKRGVR